MNNVIANAAAQVPFSPMNYVWFDFTDLNKFLEEVNQKFGEKTLDYFVEENLVTKVPMPFDQIVCVISTTEGKHFPVTIDRSENLIKDSEIKNVLLFSFWAKGLNHPASKICYEDYINKQLLIHFDSEFEKKMIEQGQRDYVEKHKQIVTILLWAIVGLSIGIGSESQRTAHKCVPNPKNQQRIKRGKKPLFEWETIVIQPKVKTHLVNLGGTHASPKPHDRRGHQRKHRSGKIVYVRPCTINKHKIPTEGFVHHDYKVTA